MAFEIIIRDLNLNPDFATYYNSANVDNLTFPIFSFFILKQYPQYLLCKFVVRIRWVNVYKPTGTVANAQ